MAIHEASGMRSQPFNSTLSDIAKCNLVIGLKKGKLYTSKTGMES